MISYNRSSPFFNVTLRIGKETNDLDITEIVGLQGDETVEYTSHTGVLEKYREILLTTKTSQVRRFGIIERRWLYIQSKLAAGQITQVKKTMKKINAFLKPCSVEMSSNEFLEFGKN